MLHAETVAILMTRLFSYTLAVSPILRVADNTKKTTKTIGVLLRSSSSDEGPGQVWMTLLEQHSPSSPVFYITSPHRCHLPYCPYHRVVSIRQPRGNSRCQSELRHNRSPLISFRAVSEEFYTCGRDSWSPRAVPFSRLLRHAKNTVALFL